MNTLLLCEHRVITSSLQHPDMVLPGAWRAAHLVSCALGTAV